MSVVIHIQDRALRLYRSGQLVREAELVSTDASDIEGGLRELFDSQASGLRQSELVDLLLDRQFFLSVSRELPARQELKQLCYELEEQVAVDAESMLVGYQPGRGEKLLCVADRSRLQLIECLQIQGFKLGRLVPLELAAAVFVGNKHALSNVTLAWNSSGRIDAFEFDSSRGIRAWVTHANVSDFELQRKLSGETNPIVWVGGKESVPDSLNVKKTIDLSLQDSANLCLKNQSQSVSGFDLARQWSGEKVRVALSWGQSALISASIVIFCVGLFFQFASWQYSQRSAELKSDVANKFDEVFPTEKRLRRRKGVDEATRQQLEKMATVREKAEEFGKQNENVRSTWIRFLNELPSPRQGNEVAYRIQSIELAPGSVVCQIELSQTKKPEWLVKQMKNWRVSDKLVGGRIYRYEFAMLDSNDSKLDIARR